MDHKILGKVLLVIGIILLFNLTFHIFRWFSPFLFSLIIAIPYLRSERKENKIGWLFASVLPLAFKVTSVLHLLPVNLGLATFFISIALTCIAVRRIHHHYFTITTPTNRLVAIQNLSLILAVFSALTGLLGGGAIAKTIVFILPISIIGYGIYLINPNLLKKRRSI